MGLGWVGLDYRGLLPSLFEEAVLNLFAKNVATAVENFQLVLDSHRWVQAVGYSGSTASEESQEDVTPPSYLMEHPPLAVFINGVSAAMNELRPCAPLNLKHILAQELVKGLKAVHNSLLRYNETRMLRNNESTLFFSLCRAFMEVAFPHCATCFGRCYPGGAALVMDAKGSFDGLTRLLSVSSSREVPRRTKSTDLQKISENRSSSMVENGVIPESKQKEDANVVENEQKSEDLKADGNDGEIHDSEVE